MTIMSSSIAYLCGRSNFRQVSEDIPVTKQRNAEKVDPPEVFDANKKELVADLVTKAKQIEYIIQSLPVPEPEQTQALRLKDLEEQMQQTNDEYTTAVQRAKALHAKITEILRTMLDETEPPPDLPG